MVRLAVDGGGTFDGETSSAAVSSGCVGAVDLWEAGREAWSGSRRLPVDPAGPASRNISGTTNAHTAIAVASIAITSARPTRPLSGTYRVWSGAGAAA